MTLSNKQKKNLDKTGDGKITREDLMILRNRRAKKAKTRARQPRRKIMREYD